jgi:hypothetical protein
MLGGLPCLEHRREPRLVLPIRLVGIAVVRLIDDIAAVLVLFLMIDVAVSSSNRIRLSIASAISARIPGVKTTIWGSGAPMVGTNSCGKYLRDVTVYGDQAEDAYVALLAGYASASNALSPGIQDVLAGTDLDGSIEWIKIYCRDHPTANFFDATAKLTQFLQKK